MKAPAYPPAAAFEQPALRPYELRVKNLPLSELMANPAAWAVVVKHMPAIKMMTDGGMVQAQLGNMTLVDFGVFGNPNNPALALIDDELKRLPAGARGAK